MATGTIKAVPSRTEFSALSEQVEKLDSNTNSTNDILATATGVTRSSFFKGSGSSYTGTVPNINMRYGVFHVDVKDSSKFVTAIGSGGEVATNVYLNSQWQGWQQVATTDQIESSVIPSNTVANIESALVTIGDSLSGNGDAKNIRFTVSTASGLFVANRDYAGTIRKRGTSRYIVNVSSTEADDITGFYYGTGWSWEQLVTKSDTSFVRTVTSNIASGGTIYLNHSGFVMLMTDRGGLWTEGVNERTLAVISEYANIAVTRESNTKLKIVSSVSYSTQLTAFGMGEQLSFSTT